MKLIRLVSFLCAAGIAAAVPLYTVTDLGSLGGSTAQAFGLNSSGLAVGGATTPFGFTHAFSSTGNGIADLTLNTTAAEGSAAGVNASGQIVGTQYINGQAFAASWTGGAVQYILGAGSYANAINDAGQTVGLFTAGDGNGHAFVESNGSVTDLGVLEGGTWASAYAINNAGDIAGYGKTSPSTFSAFFWSPQTGFVVLGALGGSSSYGMAINDFGQVAGNAQTAAGYLNAFVETGGTMEDLGTLGGTTSYAYGINDAGEVVGYSDVNGSMHAFLYENGKMIDLNSLIGPNSGWVLNAAYAINANGQIAGSGILNGVAEAFRLDLNSPGISSQFAQAGSPVPEPATSATMILALASLVILKKYSRPRFQLQPLPHPLDPPPARPGSTFSPR
jgi:probable HAF family extracellular repeat protein